MPPLHDGRILRRYQRFLADIELSDGRVVTAHVPNTGSMATCWQPGDAVQAYATVINIGQPQPHEVIASLPITDAQEYYRVVE